MNYPKDITNLTFLECLTYKRPRGNPFNLDSEPLSKADLDNIERRLISEYKAKILSIKTRIMLVVLFFLLSHLFYLILLLIHSLLQLL